jgi:beta-lactamase superfamily II metal-dependent hydrolase
MDEIFRITMLPAEDGDSLLVEIGSRYSPYRILIDGGRSGTSTIIRQMIEKFPCRSGPPAIDLVVLSHVDADHIEGLLGLIVSDFKLDVGDVWFNGAHHMAAVRGIHVRQHLERKGGEKAHPINFLSVAQGLEFGKRLAARRWPWNQAFEGRPVMTEPNQDLPVVSTIDGGKIIVMGPPKVKLEAFAPEWTQAFRDLAENKEPTLRGGRPRPVPSPKNLRSIAKNLDDADRTRPNGSSIAFVIQYRGKCALFTGDAHPDDVVAALSHLEGWTSASTFDLAKASHHGSARNNTSALTNLLKSKRWLISSNGSRHQHPDPEAIARIILGSNAIKQIIFNYQSKYNSVWSSKSLQDAFSYRTHYAEVGNPISVDLLREDC